MSKEEDPLGLWMPELVLYGLRLLVEKVAKFAGCTHWNPLLQIISTAETSDVPQELVCLIGIPFTASSALIRDWDMSGTVCDLAGFVMTTLGM